MKAYWESGSLAARILDLGTRWKWVVSFTPRPLYSQGKSPCYPLDRRLGGPQNRSGRGGEDKNSQGLPELEHPARSPELYRWAILAHSLDVVREWKFLPLLGIQSVKQFIRVTACYLTVLHEEYERFGGTILHARTALTSSPISGRTRERSSFLQTHALCFLGPRMCLPPYLLCPH
jgi:hypothetical protein